MAKVLALDYGTKRIGVALSDETKKIAFAKPYLAAAEKEKLLDIIKENEVDEILLGLPKSLKGKETKMTEEVREFQTWLKSKSKVPIKLIDERFTTQEAQRGLRGEKGLKELIDSLVAQKMLGRYLEQLNPSISSGSNNS